MKQTTKNATTNYFTVNFFNGGSIIGTKASFKKASKGTGDAYEELTRLMRENPTYTLVEKEQKNHITKAKRTYHGLNYKFMKLYIKYTQTNSEMVMKEFKAIEELAKVEKASVYPIIKSWFIEKFGELDWKTDVWFFDMTKAKGEIRKAIAVKAKENAISKAEEEAIMEIINDEESKAA